MNQSKLTRRLLALLLPTTLLSGCFSYFKANDIEFEAWETRVALPMLTGSIMMSDFTSELDTAFLNDRTDGLVEFVYEDTLISYRVADLIDIPDFSFTETFNFPIPAFPDVDLSETILMREILGNTVPSGFPIPPFSGISYTVDLPIIDEFQQVSFESGTVQVEVGNGLGAPISFQLRLFDRSSNALVGALNFSIPANGTQQRSLDLAGKTVGNDLEFRLFNLSSPGSSNTFNGGESLSFGTEFLNVQLSSMSLRVTEAISYSEDFNIEVPMPFGIEAHEISFLEGNIDFGIATNLGGTLSSRVTLLGSTQAGGPLSVAMNLSNGSGSGSASLTDAQLRLNLRTPAFNVLPVRANVTIPASNNVITISSNNTVTASVNVRNLAFDQIEGYLGSESVALETDSLNISVFQNTLNSLDLEVNLVDPKLNFIVLNEYGVPFSFNFTQARVERGNGGASNRLPIQFSQNPVQIGAGSLGNPTSTSFDVTNLNELFSFKPEVVHYGATVRLNPGGRAVNRVSHDQTITILTEVSVPLHGRVRLTATSEPISADLSADGTLEDIQTMVFHIEIDNGLPVSIRPQFYLYGENGTLLDSIFAAGPQDFASAQVDADGLVTQSTTTVVDVEIDAARLDKLTQTRELVLHVGVETANGGQQDVRMLDSYRVGARMGINATVRVNP